MLRLSVSAAALLIAGPALASGIVPPPPPPVIVPVEETWTGGYLGLQLDYIAEGSDEAGTVEAEGHLIGIFGGYRYDLGNVVVGAEIDYMIGSGETTVGTSTVDVDYDLLRVGVEVGYDLGDVLVYATAGYADITIEGTATSEGTGYFAGAGLDYRVSSNVTVGVEVLYHNFDEWNDITPELDITTVGLNVAFTF